MAVQTHHPSNVLHLKRDEQEMNSSGFGVLDESSILLSNIGGYGNPRKRGREVAINGTNQFLIQSQPSIPRPQKLIRLDQLQQSHHHPALVITGFQLAFGEQNLTHNVNQNQINLLSSSSSLCEDFAGPVSQYSKEIDQILQAQGDQLRQALAQKQQAHYKQLLLLAEKSASQIFNKKQTELDRLVQRTTELESHLAKLQTESFGWQRKAIAGQATANSIHAQIQQVMANAGAKFGESIVEDAGSACIEPNRVSQDGELLCRACRNQAVSVVVLPCRHLCLCEDCDVSGVVKNCPVCDCVGSGSVRVFLC